MDLSNKQFRFLKQQCHHLNPVVMIGAKGLTDNVLSEIDIALNHHELIKIKLNVGDKEARSAVIDRILEETAANLIQTIGHTASLFRRAEKPVIELPKA